MQTLPVFAQLSGAIDQGLDLTGDTVSNLVQNTVPIDNAGQLTKDGFSILKAIYHVMSSIHHFMTNLILAVAKETTSPEEAEMLSGFIGFASILATVIIGIRLLKGIWRHLFLFGIILFLLILGASFLNNQFSLGI